MKSSIDYVSDWVDNNITDPTLNTILSNCTIDLSDLIEDYNDYIYKKLQERFYSINSHLDIEVIDRHWLELTRSIFITK